MPDAYLRTVPSDADQDDGRLYDPTAADAGEVAGIPLRMMMGMGL